MNMKILLAALQFCCSAGHAQEKPDLTVLVEGLKDDRGQVLVALFDSPEGFPESGRTAYRSRKIPVGTMPVKVVFRDLDQGTYAVCFVHDVDGNERLDKIMGIPAEKYGVSNNIKMGFGPPGFEEAHFCIHRCDTVIRILPSN